MPVVVWPIQQLSAGKCPEGFDYRRPKIVGIPVRFSSIPRGSLFSVYMRIVRPTARHLARTMSAWGEREIHGDGAEGNTFAKHAGRCSVNQRPNNAVTAQYFIVAELQRIFPTGVLTSPSVSEYTEVTPWGITFTRTLFALKYQRRRTLRTSFSETSSSSSTAARARGPLSCFLVASL